MKVLTEYNGYELRVCDSGDGAGTLYYAASFTPMGLTAYGLSIDEADAPPVPAPPVEGPDVDPAPPPTATPPFVREDGWAFVVLLNQVFPPVAAADVVPGTETYTVEPVVSVKFVNLENAPPPPPPAPAAPLPLPPPPPAPIKSIVLLLLFQSFGTVQVVLPALRNITCVAIK